MKRINISKGRNVSTLIRSSPSMFHCTISSYRSMSSYQQYTPPDISDLNSTKWLKMDKELREEIVEYLDWKMEGSWKNLTCNDSKAAYFISFGQWGPRAKKGSKEYQHQLSTPEIIVKGIFSTILFTALGVCIINYKTDKTVQDGLDTLRIANDE